MTLTQSLVSAGLVVNVGTPFDIQKTKLKSDEPLAVLFTIIPAIYKTGSLWEFPGWAES